MRYLYDIFIDGQYYFRGKINTGKYYTHITELSTYNISGLQNARLFDKELIVKSQITKLNKHYPTHKFEVITFFLEEL